MPLLYNGQSSFDFDSLLYGQLASFLFTYNEISQTLSPIFQKQPKSSLSQFFILGSTMKLFDQSISKALPKILQGKPVYLCLLLIWKPILSFMMKRSQITKSYLTFYIPAILDHCYAFSHTYHQYSTQRQRKIQILESRYQCALQIKWFIFCGSAKPSSSKMAIQELIDKVIIIQFSSDSLALMNTLNLFPEEEFEEEKNIFPSYESLSPTPSPQPSHSHLQFIQGNTSSTQIQMVTPYSPSSKGGRRGRKGSEQLKNVNRGHWSTEENKKYHWFLEIHYTHFVNRHMRRMDKIFKTMELFIGTRQAEQCRSHHQKMQKKYLNFTTIISNLRKTHYNSIEIEPILQDLNACGIEAEEGLASIDQLMEHQSLETVFSDFKDRKKSSSFREEKVNDEKVVQRQENIELHNIQEEKSEEIVHHPVNMLEDCNMDFGELSWHHEKEENSSIFNSIFL